MNSKLLLVKGITLLYRESQLPSIKENSSDLVRQIISSIKLPEINVELNHTREVLEALRRTALTMCEDPIGHEYDSIELLQRLKVDTGEETELYDALFTGISGDMTEQALKRTCITMRRALINHQREERAVEIVNKAAYQMKFDRSNVDIKQLVSQIGQELEVLGLGATDEEHPAMVSEIDFGDEEKVAEVFKEVKASENGEGIMVTGFQGLNRMLDGGFRRGEEVVIGALQHKYKSGFSLTLFKHLALYNKPYMIDTSKKPLLVHMSFENSVEMNTQFLYASLKENETGVKCDITDIPEAEMARYVKEKLTVNGYHIKMMRIDPTLYSYKDICNKILQYEAEGYEIHALMLDYLAMVPTVGCTQGAMGQDVRDLYRRMRNFTEPRKITLITPHQLSTEAKMQIREGRQDFVKNLVNGGYYDKCKTVDNEVDLEIFIHIEIVNGVSYLTIQRGKHRKVAQTPSEHLYCVLQFHEVGGLLDDINGPDSTRRKVGGGPIGSADEVPFWEFNDAA